MIAVRLRCAPKKGRSYVDHAREATETLDRFAMLFYSNYFEFKQSGHCNVFPSAYLELPCTWPSRYS